MLRETSVASTETTIARATLARQKEDMVLAEAQLAGERRVAVARLVLIGLVALSVAGSQRGQAPDPVMAVAGPLYALLGAVALVMGRRNRPTLRKAMIFPFVLPTVDFGFLTFAGLRLQHKGAPEHAAVVGAVYLVFSLLRPPASIVYSTILALASNLALAWNRGALASFGTLSVSGAYVALGLLLWRSNLALRTMFLSLRRRDNLSRFIAAPLVERLLAGGEAALRPVQREVTVLFLDVRNFTAFSERLAPREVLEFLDDLLGRMSQIVKGHEGIVNKFLGDGMLAFWGVPEPKADHARAALRASLDMRKELTELQRSPRAQRPGRGAHRRGHSHRRGRRGHDRRRRPARVHHHRRRGERRLAHRGAHQAARRRHPRLRARLAARRRGLRGDAQSGGACEGPRRGGGGLRARGAVER